tara:strand:+ start:1973 stop:2947 length:975 start_codon:yes stop_codon:yes gene_type:complete
MKISVIIPSYNPKPDKIALCLKEIHSSSLKPFEIILVDDGSTEDYMDKIKPYCKILRNKKNRGPAYSRNAGAKKAEGDILCFIDSDVKINQTTLSEIAKKFDNTDIAAVQTIYSKFTPVRNFISQYMNLYQHYNFKTIKHKYLNTLSGYCIAIRRDVFFEVGGFDEHVKSASIEDEHLGIALISKGYKILMAKDISVEHMDYYNLTKLLKRMFIMGREKGEWMGSNPKTRKIEWSRTNHSLNLISSILISPLILVLFLTMMWPVIPILFVVAVLTFGIINADFFIFLLKSRGVMFMLKSTVTYYLMSLSLFFGAVKGGMNYLVK